MKQLVIECDTLSYKKITEIENILTQNEIPFSIVEKTLEQELKEAFPYGHF